MTTVLELLGELIEEIRGLRNDLAAQKDSTAPYIPPYIPPPSFDHKKCTSCGLHFGNITAYVCTVPHCPQSVTVS